MRAAGILLGLLVCPTGLAQQALPLHPEQARVLRGDDPAFAAPELDDSGWELRGLDGLPRDNGVYWFRVPVVLPERDSQRPLTVLFSALWSFEVFWDGRWVGASGVVGTRRETEVPGALDEIVHLPSDAVQPGPHLLAMRASNQHYGGELAYPFYVLEIDEASSHRGLALSAVLPLFFLGAFVLIGVWYLALFVVVRRQAAVLVLSLLCFSVAGLLLAESWRAVFGYPWHLHVWRLRIVWGTSLLTCILLPTLLLLRFGLRPAWPWHAANLLALAAAQTMAGYDGTQSAMFQGSLAVSIAIAGVAAWRRQPGGLPALGGLLPCLAIVLVDPYAFVDRTVFLGFAVLIGVLLILNAQHTRDRDLQRHRAEAVSARLEAELLKRQIQPHFLLNTLTHVSEWLERDPRQGVAMIEELADELRRLGAAARTSRIPLAEELALCRAHLALMGRRLGRRLELAVQGVDETEPVPPALFHTLIENGLSHNRLPEGDVRFELRARADNGETVYELTAPGWARAPRRADGTGLRYVKSRLEESYPGRWRFSCGPFPDGPRPVGWRSVIAVPRRRAAP